MRKLLLAILLMSSVAQAAYSPNTIITDPTTPANQAKVTASTPAGTDNALACVLHPNSSPIGISGSVAVTGTFWQATQPVSAASLPLPTGASTSALQTTANTSLSSIDTKLTGPLSTKAPVNANASYQQFTATTLDQTATAPTNTVAVVIQGDNTNNDCIRWALGTSVTSSSGMVAQAGQDTGVIQSGVSVHYAACSSTQKVNIQWILSQ